MKKLSPEQALDNLAKAIVARAIADACQADSLCSERGAKEARKWLKSTTADLYSDGRAKKAVEAMEHDYEGFRQRFCREWKTYGKQRA